MSKPKMYANKVGMGNSRNTNYFHVTVHKYLSLSKEQKTKYVGYMTSYCSHMSVLLFVHYNSFDKIHSLVNEIHISVNEICH